MTYPIMTKPTTLPVQITDPPIINHPAGGKARLRRAAQRRGRGLDRRPLGHPQPPGRYHRQPRFARARLASLHGVSAARPPSCRLQAIVPVVLAPYLGRFISALRVPTEVLRIMAEASLHTELVLLSSRAALIRSLYGLARCLAKKVRLHPVHAVNTRVSSAIH